MFLKSRSIPRGLTPLAVFLAGCIGASAIAAPPKVVTAPNSDPACFTPWAADTKMFQYPAKKGPYRIALANGYVANTWRIQMIKTAKAYAMQKDVAAKLKEYKVVSTGEDVAAVGAHGVRPRAGRVPVTSGAGSGGSGLLQLRGGAR